MAADLHIHVMDGVEEEDMRCFFSHHSGHKYFAGFFTQEDCKLPGKYDFMCGHHDRVSDTPNFRIGEVSWLKAALFDDDSYIPNPVARVSELIGEDEPELTEELRDKILQAVQAPNETHYDVYGNAGDDVSLEDWLNQHLGKKLFTISW